MKRHRTLLLLAPVVLVTVCGCDAIKSSNPTSPDVAGPIAGVSITAPTPVTPGQGSTIRSEEQPVTLTVQNSTTNGQRPITYVFELASDSGFSNRILVREGIQPGGDGKTALRLPDALAADRTYFWRAKAEDGANASPYSAAVSFAVVNIAVIQPPVPVAPIGGATTSSQSPQFSVQNSSRTGPAGAISYTFEISENESFTAMVAVVTIAEGTSPTKFTIAQQLKERTRHYWRARAFDSNVMSDWTVTQSFVTPAAPTVPTPTPTPTPTPGSWPRTGEEVVNYVTTRYPDKLVAGVSLSQRQANMAFIRDRMIEAGICGGMDLGLNLKRGGPEISIDFLVHRSNGQDIGVDIGYDYDNTSTTLRVYWGAGAPGPYYQRYTPRPTCQ
ncbi:MAG: hypothetical protein NTY02_10000 [Acidobacteria bacterium]|nr:hypothetical protein [Acidobacteriota bacterium]